MLDIVLLHSDRNIYIFIQTYSSVILLTNQIRHVSALFSSLDQSQFVL